MPWLPALKHASATTCPPDRKHHPLQDMPDHCQRLAMASAFRVSSKMATPPHAPPCASILSPVHHDGVSFNMLSPAHAPVCRLVAPVRPSASFSDDLCHHDGQKPTRGKLRSPTAPPFAHAFMDHGSSHTFTSPPFTIPPFMLMLYPVCFQLLALHLFHTHEPPLQTLTSCTTCHQHGSSSTFMRSPEAPSSFLVLFSSFGSLKHVCLFRSFLSFGFRSFPLWLYNDKKGGIALSGCSYWALDGPY